MSRELASELDKRFAKSEAESVLDYFINEYKSKLAFSTSLGAEDQVLTHMIWSKYPEARIFTLDTGRLFQDTYELIDKVHSKYGKRLEIFFPDKENVEKMVAEKGVNLFYQSIENRKECCHTRKTEPLGRALSGVEAWVTGIRREQAVTRYSTPMVEWNDQYKLLKVNPLRDWTEEMVWEYIRKHDIPYNTLHDKGFPSIGCAPCTRAVAKGEDVRAGRWWWEQPENKECGIHVTGK
jgi:phosphoadenosine phosphosulfate reductase